MTKGKPAMKKIALYIKNMSGGGAQRHMAVVANILDENGYDVTVISFNKRPKNPYYLNPGIKIKNLVDSDKNEASHSLFSSYLYRIKRRIIKLLHRKNAELRNKKLRFADLDYKVCSLVRKHLKKEKYDVILPFMTDSCIYVSRASRGLKSKICTCVMAFPSKIYNNDFQTYLRDLYFKNADANIFQTIEQAEVLKPNVSKNIFDIHNPIKDNLPYPSGRERKNIIVNFCRLDPVKNLKLLISAFKIFSGEYPDYKLYIYGEGPQHDELIRLIDELGLNGKVLIKPFEKNIHEIILDYKMFVSSSDSEGISNSIIEAMGIGLPVISTNADGGGAKAVIRDGENGLIVPKGNADEMYKAMKRIANDSDFASKLSENGVKIKETLSAQNIGKQWIDAIESVL